MHCPYEFDNAAQASQVSQYSEHEIELNQIFQYGQQASLSGIVAHVKSVLNTGKSSRSPARQKLPVQRTTSTSGACTSAEYDPLKVLTACLGDNYY
jgi:hypothetical protein